jgi:hypothetical protein
MTLEVLVILPCVEDRLGLLKIIRHSKWHLVLTETLHGSLAPLNEIPSAILVV